MGSRGLWLLGGRVSCQGSVEGGRKGTNMFRAVMVPARKAVVRMSRVLWRCIFSIESGDFFFFFFCKYCR